MALLDVADVTQGVATLMDDPSQSEIDQDYVLPFLNLRWANLIVNLAMLGLQYAEEQAILSIPAGTTSLTNFMTAGQPLASLMSPVDMQWKLKGAPDEQYDDVDPVRELDDLPPSPTIQQYAFKGGSIFITPSSVDTVLRVNYKAMSTRLVDPTDDMIRGVGDIIAFRTAELMLAVRGNPLKVDMKTYGDDALEDFCAMSVLRDQSNFNVIPPTHPRTYRGGFVAHV